MSGFFGCVSRNDCVLDVFYGTDYHSHLGTKRAGMAFVNDENEFSRKIHSLENAYFRNKFEGDLPKFEGAKIGIGVISDMQSQPITITSHLGRFSVIIIGRIDNIDELIEEMLEKRVNFSELSGGQVNPTELIALMISQGNTYKEGIEIVQQKVKGSCSMLIMTSRGIYAVRDKLGRTPIVVGKNKNGYVVASENSSFVNLDYMNETELKPSQALFFTADGYTEVVAPGKCMQMCSFLWVYYGYPSSSYEGINVEDSRYNNGSALAIDDADLTNIDFASGVPDSGIGHAIGYSNQKRVPYKRAFVKYTPTWPRSFMPQNQNMRDLVAKMKLLPNETFTNGSRMVLLDDSIVRGTQLKDNIVKLIDAGAIDINIRIACPPLVYPCKFLNFSSSRSTFDLFTRRIIRDLEDTEEFTEDVLQEYANPDSARYKRMIEVMSKAIGSTSLKFQRLDAMVAAIGLPKEKLCTHCWDNSSYME